MNDQKYTIGVISDTHGKMDPKVSGVFQGVDHIIHAGDVCGLDIIPKLRKIAPVTAVKGNMDSGDLGIRLKATETIKFGRALVYVLHISHMLDIEPDKDGFNVIITGHTHVPQIETKNKVLYLNPGSATLPRHQNLPSVALLSIDGQDISAEIIKLK